MRIVFFGSGEFAIPSLAALLARGHELPLVVTQPDRERGRGRELAPPPVKVAAQRLSLRVFQPRRVRAPESQEELRKAAPDLQVVAAYGQILPQAVIDIAPLGTVNVHASLLPRYRGAAPIQWAIADGEAQTGVTTMMIDAGLDTGGLLGSRATAIAPDETSPQLQERLAALGAQLLIETVDALAAGTLRAVPQDEALASHARILVKDDGRVEWSWPAAKIANRVRAFDPWPGVFTTLAGKGVRLHRVRVAAGATGDRAAPGTVLQVDDAGVTVACGGDTALVILEAQPESRRTMPAAAFAAGARLAAGSRFGA